MSEVKLLDKRQYGETRAYTIATACQLYKNYNSIRKMYPVFTDMVYENRKAWRVYNEWIIKFPSGIWPNGKPLNPPEGVLMQLKISTLQRELKRAGVGSSKKSRFSKYPIGDDWILVAEKQHWRDKYCTRFNVTHVHPDGKHWLVDYYKPFSVCNQAPMGEIKLKPCPVCNVEMSRQVEVWIRMIRLKEKISE